MKRNRIITTLIIVCMSLFLAFGLVGCKKDCDHVYDNACDAICNVCSETREVGEHTPAEDDGDCTTEAKCTVCSEVLTAAKEHDFDDTEWQSNETQHWHVCKNEGCNVTDEKIDHTSDGAATVDKPEKCSVCQYIITPQLPQNTSEQAVEMFKRYFCDSGGKICIYPLDDYNHIWAYAPFGENACEVFSNITGLDVEAKESYTYSYISDDKSVEISITGTLAPDDNGVYATLYVTIPEYEDIEQIKLVTIDYINSINQ